MHVGNGAIDRWRLLGYIDEISVRVFVNGNSIMILTRQPCEINKNNITASVNTHMPPSLFFTHVSFNSYMYNPYCVS